MKDRQPQTDRDAPRRTSGPAPAHAGETHDVAERLGVDVTTGLSGAEAAHRRDEHGPNRLRRQHRRGAAAVLLDQLNSTVIVILAVAGAIAFVSGRVTEGVAIAAVIVVNAAIGFVSEWKAARSMEALRRLGATGAVVRRDGSELEVPAADIVPGDVVVCGGGSTVPADLRIVEADGVRAQEAALTGESAAVSKQVAPVAADAPLAERRSMLFSGTTVVRGRAVGVAVATGTGTELGSIAELAEEAEAAATPLQRRLDRLGRRLALVTAATAVAVAGAGLLAGRPAVLMIETAIALGVAAIPEGLPIVATIALARGMWLMARRNAVVHRLPAVETLGATRVILTDKTGTLTENRMTLHTLVTAAGEHDPDRGAPDDPVLRRALEVAVLSNEARLDDGGEHGDATEIALLRAGRDLGMDRTDLTAARPEVRTVPFDSDTMMMATFHRTDDGIEIAVKGAPDRVLAAARAVATADGDRPLDDDERERWRQRTDELASRGLRLLAIADRRGAGEEDAPFEGLRFLGLVGLLDPPRDDVGDAIGECHRAGIRVVMVTGDQPATAEAVARQVGLAGRDGAVRVLTGADLGPDGADASLDDAVVFARVSPAEKLGLVARLQDRGEIVAMTGDGVNDAPALKKADIGVAMGRRGTDAARQAADMVLRDDAFSTIVAAVREGRIIFSNIRTSVLFMLCTNGAEVLAVAVASLLNAPLPLLPLQILFLNVVTDVFPALALAVGKGGPRVMDRPPRPSGEPILAGRHWAAVAAWSTALAATVLAGLFVAVDWLGMDRHTAVTVSFMVLAFGKLWFVLNLRAPHSGLVDNEIVRNPWIWAAAALCTGLLVAAVYLPVLSGVLGTRPLTPSQWALVAALSLAPTAVGQVIRAVQGWREGASILTGR